MTPLEDRAALIAEAERRVYCRNSVTSPCAEWSSNPKTYCDHCLISALLAALRAAHEERKPLSAEVQEAERVSAALGDDHIARSGVWATAARDLDLSLWAARMRADKAEAENIHLRVQLAQLQEVIRYLRYPDRSAEQSNGGSPERCGNKSPVYPDGRWRCDLPDGHDGVHESAEGRVWRD